MNEEIPLTKKVGPLREWTDTACIRQWWYLYYEMLRPGCPEFIRDEFKIMDGEVANRGISNKGPMTRKVAEDLASIVDEYKRKNL